MKYVILRRTKGDTWERIGAAEVDEDEVVEPEQAAIEEVAQQTGATGAYVAIPLPVWQKAFEAEAQVTVRPVLAGRPSPSPEGAELVEDEEEEELGPGLDDLAGMRRPPQ